MQTNILYICDRDARRKRRNKLKGLIKWVIFEHTTSR